jgi:hypothetical protein
LLPIYTARKYEERQSVISTVAKSSVSARFLRAEKYLDCSSTVGARVEWQKYSDGEMMMMREGPHYR